MKNDRKIFNDYLVALGVQHFDGKIDDVIQMLANYRDKYLAEGYFDINVHASQYYDEVNIGIRGNRYETDKEYEKRLIYEKQIVEREKKEKKKRAEEEKKLYERLKKKYG